MSEISDQHLLRAFGRGDSAAFDALYHRYARRVHATAYRLTRDWEDAEDALQEVFIRLARKPPELRSGLAFSSYLYRMTIHCAADCIRRRRATVSLDAPLTPAAEVIAVESLRREAERDMSLRRESLLRRIEAMIPRLPERQAAAFVLRSFQGLSHREIAAIMGCGEGAAKSHCSLARAKLREWARAEEAADAEAERARGRDARGPGRAEEGGT